MVMNTRALYCGGFISGTPLALELATFPLFQSPAHLCSCSAILRKEQMLVAVSNHIPLEVGLFFSEKSFFAEHLSFWKVFVFLFFFFSQGVVKMIGKYTYVKGVNIEKTQYIATARNESGNFLVFLNSVFYFSSKLKKQSRVTALGNMKTNWWNYNYFCK